MKDHKEMIKTLTAHLILADYPAIELSVIELIIDAHRLHVINHLPDYEKEIIMKRMKHNEAEFLSFVRNGPKENSELELVSGD